MSERDDQRRHGVEETVPAWEPPPVLRPRPVAEPIDWDGLLDEIERDFPKTLARLAE